MAFFLKRKKRETENYCAAVVAAAGTSSRMGQDKIMLTLGDVPVIVHTLRALECCSYIHEIVVVTREELLVPISKLCAEHVLTKVRKVVIGGSSRVQSVNIGIGEVSPRANLIAIHDGARPFVSQELLFEVISSASINCAAAPAIPVKDTIKQAENGIVVHTPDRKTLYAVQTPQVFEADLIRAALYKVIHEDICVTDDCSAVELLGKKVSLTNGSEENIKITTPSDLAFAQALLLRRDIQ